MAATLAASTLFATAATPQSLGDLLGDDSTEAVTINIACGKLDKANCDAVLPAIADKLPEYITLQPIESKGSTESALGVCRNVVPMAVGQYDAFIALMKERTECANKYEMVGKPLYP